MSPLLVKAGKAGGKIVEVTPESAGWTHVGFAAHRLQAGEHISLETGHRELCLVVLTGTVT
ncbi:5-deoxy-glucuronate isomerase, partial [Janthinobacterium sp. HH100]